MPNALLAALGVLLYPVGIQVYTYLLLLRHRHELWVSHKVQKRYGLVYLRYEKKYFFWELTEMQRKLLLTSVISFIARGTMLQVVASIIIAVVFLIAHIKYQPYEKDNDDDLASAALVSTLLTLLCAALIVAKDATPGVGILMVAVNLFVVLVSLYALIVDIVPSLIEECSDHYESLMAAVATLDQLNDTLPEGDRRLEEETSASELLHFGLNCPPSEVRESSSGDCDCSKTASSGPEREGDNAALAGALSGALAQLFQRLVQFYPCSA